MDDGWKRHFTQFGKALDTTLSSLSATNTSLQKCIDRLTVQVSEKVHEIKGAHDIAVEAIKGPAKDTKRKRKKCKMIWYLPVLERVAIELEGIDLNLYKKIGEYNAPYSDSSLKFACAEAKDAVIGFRRGAVNATLTLANTTFNIVVLNFSVN